MIITKEMVGKLRHNDTSDPFKLELKGYVNSKSRVQTIIDCVKDCKKDGLLNIGIGSSPTKIKSQLKENKFLYDVLYHNFNNMMGVDNNEETINIMKELKYKNVFYADIVSPKTKAMAATFFEETSYVILLADKLEHAENPVTFLKQIIRAYGNKNNKFVISVPNVYAYQRVLRMTEKGIETVNVDHKYMFSPMTILKVCVTAGLIPERIEFAGYFDLNSNDVSAKLDDSKYMMGHNIILTCSFR
jgi:hypothetical protein